MKTVKGRMDIDMLTEDLDRTHCVVSLKTSKEGKPKPIIIESARYDVRKIQCTKVSVYTVSSIQGTKKVKKLKGKNFMITESLRATRVGLLKEVQGKCGLRNNWITDDRILYRENNRAFLYEK